MYINKASNPRQFGSYNSQGFISEDTTTSACTDTPNASYNTGIISFSTYVYITDTTTKQYIYCKETMTGFNMNRGVWFGINGANQIFVEINNNPTLAADTVDVRTGAMNFQIGWNMLGCYGNPVITVPPPPPVTIPPTPPDPTVYETFVEWYSVMPDGTTSTSPSFSYTVDFKDSDLYVTWVGGRKTNRNTATNVFTGMINQVTQFSDQVTLADLQAMVSHSCDVPCPICLANNAPTCLEYKKSASIGSWDFTSPDYQSTSYDKSPNGYNFNLINNQSLYDPIYVHNQGLYFDGTSHIRTTNKWMQNTQLSMTFEGWIRPTTSPLTGDLLAFESAPNKNDAKISFNGNNIVFTLGTTTATIPITYTNVGDWHYVGVSIHKIGANRSRVCAVFGTGAESCVTVNTILTTTATGNTFQVGNNFKGMIKDFQLLDWPKRGYEFTSMVQTAGCTPFNGVGCPSCPSTTGACISKCTKNQYGPTCATCLDPNWASCYGNTFDQWYECKPGFDFTYNGQSWPGEWGNGVKEAYLKEYCDDGNLLDGDGWNSKWVIEPSWACSEKTATSPSICTRKCEYTFGYYYGFHECQDGNNDALDGCFNCQIERGWKCEDGSPWNPDTCSELWGDGINYGEHECDDGNNINGDGCSAVCLIENPGPPMWLCSSGNEKAPDFCHEWCGDGFRYENPWLWNPRRNLFRLQEVTCDDGNLRSGEGCDGLCRIEEGFTCAGGSGTNPDVCKEECGDRRTFYYDQCDDGNLTPGDGCNANCLMEAGFECLGGSPIKVTDCSEICGDFKNMGWHTWDDGNLISGDGCSSTCVTEPGFMCTGGDNDEGDSWTELCGDGKNAGKLPCDDKNLMDGDGCSSKCLVEPGYKCTGGSPTSRDYCTEICGDGINMLNYQCDDGDNDNGDGCSSTWTIEPGWGCLSGSPSYCYKAKRPWISSATINSDSSQITLNFNTTVKFTSTWSIKDWRLEMFGPRENYNFTYSIAVDQDASTTFGKVIIKIQYDKQLFGYDMEYIVLTFINRFTTVDTNFGLEMINTQFTFYLDGKEVSSNAIILESLGTATFYIFLACAGLMLTAGVFGYPVGVLFDIYSTLQLIHLFPLGRFYMPTGLFKFFKSFERLNFQNLNFGIWNYDQIIDTGSFIINGNQVNYNFKKMGFTSSSFILTSTDVIMWIIYFTFFPILIRVLGQLFFRSTMVKNLERQIMYPFLPIVVYLTTLILSFTAFLNFIEFNIATGSESAGSLASYGYLVFIFLFLIVLFIITWLYWYELRNQEKKEFANLAGNYDSTPDTLKGKIFFSSYRTKHFMHYFYPCYYIIRRILIATIFSIWKFDGFMQLMLLSLLSWVSLVWFTSYQPYASRFRNIIATMLEVSYLIICMTLFPYVYPDLSDYMFEKQASTVIGLFCTVFYLAMFIPAGVAISQLMKRPKKHPIFQPSNETVPLSTKEDVRREWIEGAPKPEKKFGKLKQEILYDEEVQDLDEKGPKANEKGGLQTLEDESEGEESEEEESETEYDSDSDETKNLNMEEYGNLKRIPQAEVNLDAGYNTGLSGLREAQIQQYREREKRMF